MTKNGYDHYLDFQFDYSGHFFKMLFGAIAYADVKNTEKLRLAFPEEVEAYETWTQIGVDIFLSKCSPGNPIVQDIADGSKEI